MSTQRPSFAKRDREMKLKDKARAKAERRAAKKAAKAANKDAPAEGEDLTGDDLNGDLPLLAASPAPMDPLS